jgi:peptide/nickel transport system substrate-binding protein
MFLSFKINLGLLGAILVLLSLSFSKGHAETLRVAAGGMPPSLGNPYTATALPATELWLAMFDGLTRLDWRGGPLPGLAVSWDNLTPLKWRFTLRSGMTFHNGRPLTAVSVANVFAFLLSKGAASFIVARELTNIADVIAIGPLTVQFNLRTPDVILPKRLSLVMIIELDSWLEQGADGFAMTPIGTGPYQLVDWGAGNAAPRLTAFEASWRAPKGYSSIVYSVVSNKTSRLQALYSGQVDLATGLSEDDVGDVEANGYIPFVTTTTQIKSIALPNMQDGQHPLKDQRVRQALNYAVDKQSIADVILGGWVDVASQGAVSGISGYNATLKPYPYDPARARALLEDAGYANGFDMDIEFVATLTPLDPVLFQKVAQDLNEIGIRASVRQIPFSDFLRKYVQNQWGDVDAFGLFWNSATFQDAIRPFEYFSCFRTNPFFCDQDVTADIRAVQIVSDPVERETLMQTIMAKYHALAPAIWITNSAYVSAMRPGINNFRMIPAGIAFEELGF